MENYQDFKKSFYDLSQIDLNAYKEKQMKRRIETLITRKGFNSFEEYSQRLKKNKKELEYFTDYITINVTEFFRKAEYWKFLEEKVIPVMAEKITKSDKKLKVWSAGCSSGEEPYSLSMLLLKYFEGNQFQILATDIDEKVLEKAENGIFSEQTLKIFPEEYKEYAAKYFDLKKMENPEKNQFAIKDEVKNQVEFRKLDMTKEDFPKECDLIVCRNVLIYFTEETKQTIFKKFYDSLTNAGVLFLGHAEQIVYYKNFGFEKLAKNFYKK